MMHKYFVTCFKQFNTVQIYELVDRSKGLLCV